VLAGVALVVVLSWVGLRRVAVAAHPSLSDPESPGAGVAVVLVSSFSVLLLWVLNPFAALLCVPALHLWLLGTLVNPLPPKRARVAMLIGGLLAPILLAFYQLAVLSLDPLAGAWYLLLLLAGGHIGTLTALVAAALISVLVAVLSIVRAGSPPEADPSKPPAPSVRGPSSYAGPGSLGGTESALPRR
jgi:hypothetical protein